MAAGSGILATSAPVWADWMLCACTWAAAVLLGYVAAQRVNHDRGLFLLAMRLVATGWALYAVRLTFILLTIGDLPLTWWATGPLMMMAIGSVALAIERIKLGRGSR